MESSIEITASNVTLDIPIYDHRARSFRHAWVLTPIAKAVRGAVHVGGVIKESNGVVVVRAIDDISFNIKKGERVGIIGHNGAGKTSLLRAIAGIFEPTGGTLSTAGRIMPLFNLMEGFMPDSTGREFIRIRGVLLGLDPKVIEKLSEEVAEFCELGDYIDMPIRTYSTGMLVRVAFAVATSVTSDILLFDELIGAGDARFVKKGQERLRSFAERSSIIVIATHSPDILRSWCTRALLLEHGKLLYDGDVESTLKAHRDLLAASMADMRPPPAEYLPPVSAAEGATEDPKVRRLETRVRRLEKQLGRKTKEVENLKKAFDLVRAKKPLPLSLSGPKDSARKEKTRSEAAEPKSSFTIAGNRSTA